MAGAQMRHLRLNRLCMLVVLCSDSLALFRFQLRQSPAELSQLVFLRLDLARLVKAFSSDELRLARRQCAELLGRRGVALHVEGDAAVIHTWRQGAATRLLLHLLLLHELLLLLLHELLLLLLHLHLLHLLHRRHARHHLRRGHSVLHRQAGPGLRLRRACADGPAQGNGDKADLAEEILSVCVVAVQP